MVTQTHPRWEVMHIFYHTCVLKTYDTIARLLLIFEIFGPKAIYQVVWFLPWGTKTTSCFRSDRGPYKTAEVKWSCVWIPSNTANDNNSDCKKCCEVNLHFEIYRYWYRTCKPHIYEYCKCDVLYQNFLHLLMEQLVHADISTMINHLWRYMYTYNDRQIKCVSSISKA